MNKPSIRPKSKPCLQKKELPFPDGMPLYDVQGQYRTKKGDCWVRCREEFHHELMGEASNRKAKSRRVAIYYGTSQPEGLARLVRFVESRINLRYSQRTRVFICRDKPKEGEKKKKFRVAYVEISPFWTSQEMRASFFTILLRASRNSSWKKPWTNPLDILLGQDYLVQTPLGTAMFLCGQTLQKQKDFCGWVDEFEDSYTWTSDVPSKIIGPPKSSSEKKYFRSKSIKSLLSKAERAKLRQWAKDNGVSDKHLKFIEK